MASRTGKRTERDSENTLLLGVCAYLYIDFFTHKGYLKLSHPNIAMPLGAFYATAMNNTAILIIALALAVDAFAVALAAGISLPQVSIRHTFRLAWHFGLFQGGMTVIGWAGGLTFRSLIESFDHWLAFSLLLLIGARMIYQAFALTEQEKAGADPTRGISLIMLSVATSIDALAVGLSFALLQTQILMPALVIGIVASLLTALGLHLGRMVSRAEQFGTVAELGGGLVLIAIGIKILFEHGVFH